MNETGLFALAGIAGLALLAWELGKWRTRQFNRKRLMNIQLASQSEWEQERREM